MGPAATPSPARSPGATPAIPPSHAAGPTAATARNGPATRGVGEEPLSLFFRLLLVVNLTARAFAARYGRKHRIALTEWRVLHALALGHRSAGALVEALGLDKMAISRAVRGLEAMGRLVRRPDPRDGRRDVLEITKAGLALHDEIAREGATREAMLVGALSPDDLARLHRILDALTDAARALPGGDPDGGGDAHGGGDDHGASPTPNGSNDAQGGDAAA